MRVFVAGATGAIGTRLVPQLVERGHEVIGTTRSEEKARRLDEVGAEPVVLDVLDQGAVGEAVAAARPDAIVHEATALSGVAEYRNLDRTFAQTTACEPPEPTRSSQRYAGPASTVSSGRASRAGPTHAWAARSRPRRTRDTGGIALRYSGSTARPTTPRSRPSKSGGSRRASPGSTTWSTTILHPCASGCLRSRPRSVRSRRGTSRVGSPVASRAMGWSRS
jgi:hypothetical protein